MQLHPVCQSVLSLRPAGALTMYGDVIVTLSARL